jgi:hypothetical protein
VSPRGTGCAPHFRVVESATPDMERAVIYPRAILALTVTGALCACNPMTSPDAKPDIDVHAALSPNFGRVAPPRPVHFVFALGQFTGAWTGYPVGQARVAFGATVDANGAVRGRFSGRFKSPDVRIEMDIKCASFSGNDAWLSATVTESSDVTKVAVGNSYAWRVREVSEGRKGDPDSSSDFFSVSDGTTACMDKAADTLHPWTFGNIEVK